MNDFKFNYYLTLYKDKTMINRNEFRKNFRKKHGNYKYIEELIIAIENHQFKKYGQTLNSHYVCSPTTNEKEKLLQSERCKKWYKKKYGKIL